MNISHTFIVLCNIMLAYSLIKPGISSVYKRNFAERDRKNLTFNKANNQTLRIFVDEQFIFYKKDLEDDDNTTSVRINLNPDPTPTYDHSLRHHMLAMLFI